MKMEYLIRPIVEKDNLAIAQVIRNVFEELGAPKVGTAYADPFLEKLSEFYHTKHTTYFVVEYQGKVFGGAGIGLLKDKICELQKMYFSPEIRGKGIGMEMMLKCLAFAQNNGFEKCYLETLPLMKDAQKLYQKAGFSYVTESMGNTGHNSCTVFMVKDL
jgi:putative acetyltransferase